MAELSFPDLESEVAAVTSCMCRLRQTSPDGTLEGLMSAVSVKEGAKVNLVLSLVLMSVEFSMLRFHGMRPADAPCTKELTRVKTVYRRYQELTQKEGVEGMQPRVDKAVAGRLVQFHTSQPPDCPEQVKPTDVGPSAKAEPSLNDTTKIDPSTSKATRTQSSDAKVSSTPKLTPESRPAEHDGAKDSSVKIQSLKNVKAKPKDPSVKVKSAKTKLKDASTKVKSAKGAKTKRALPPAAASNHLKPEELVIELSDDTLPLNPRKRGRPPVKPSKRRKASR
ncbi:MAG: hypothetical protein KVP17_002314 [Porospora cf. gigantea B]|uniref:uncharacterized protein n=1 Tax=Porospora cf. gigantea B TaxID=2853592 RepID=UPI003571836E|nr:MAG: hypothetical protein KVP17_002314 [Porospora cf. gigantea B]